MDKELFKQKLSEVAEWRVPEVAATDIKKAKQLARGRSRKSDEELYQEEHEQVFLEMFNGVNPTQPIELVKVCSKMQTCEHCHIPVPGGPHIEQKLNLNTKGKAHWRERCLTCNKSKDPYTGQFNLTGTEASVKWNSYLREVNARYKKTDLPSTNEERCVITYYGRETE